MQNKLELIRNDPNCKDDDDEDVVVDDDYLTSTGRQG